MHYSYGWGAVLRDKRLSRSLWPYMYVVKFNSQLIKGQMYQNFDFSIFLPNLLIKSQINKVVLKFQSNWTLHGRDIAS